MRILAVIALAACGGGGGGGGGDAGGGSDGSVTSPIAGARIFFTDLTSGPNSGGEAGNGAYVTIYGNGFGSAQGGSTVTVGGGTVAAYPVWSETKITMSTTTSSTTPCAMASTSRPSIRRKAWSRPTTT